jgi:hypothetical protein
VALGVVKPYVPELPDGVTATRLWRRVFESLPGAAGRSVTACPVRPFVDSEHAQQAFSGGFGDR